MGIINEHFTMPGADIPPQEFLTLKTQQGQINWLAQFLMSVNSVFDNVSGTVTTLEPDASAYVEIEFDDVNNSATFDFYVPQGQTGAPGHLESLTATAQTLAAGQSATATVVFDETTQSGAFTFGIPTTNPTDSQVTSAVDSWLDAHPEATTTVQDNSITNAKLVQSGGVLEEVEDIREGYDGTVYVSAGDAVREQVRNLDNKFLPAIDVMSFSGKYYMTDSTLEHPNRIKNQIIWLEAGSVVELLPQYSNYKLGVDQYSDIYNYHDFVTRGVLISTSGWLTPCKYVVPESGFTAVIIRKNDNSDFSAKNDCDGYIKIYKRVFSSDVIDGAIQRDYPSNGASLLNAHFSHGGLAQGNGVMQLFRVMTPIVVTARTNMIIKAKTGFRFGIHTFVNDAFSSDSGWQTDYTLPANTSFKIVIARQTEDQTETANVNTFVSNIEFYDAEQIEINSIEESITHDSIKKLWITSAHRGYIYPSNGVTLHENTLAAFYVAAQNGAGMIETDARLSSDGILMANHDATVTDINGDTYTIANETAATLNALVLSQDAVYGTQYLPTLEQVLNLAYNTGMDVNIDLKNGYAAADQAARLVWKCGMRGHVVYGLNGSGMQSINSIIALDPLARFIDNPTNFNASTLAGLDDYESRCFAYTADLSSSTINSIRNSGCMLATIGLTANNFSTAITYHPEMCEFPHTSDFRTIENNYFDNLMLY